MRIESIETHAVLVPLTMPTASQPLRINGREYVIVRIVDEGGASGIGYGRRLQAGSPLRP
jgi:L-alanine-DL-glutamate epimerase-like enolase superfamily enzyme